MTREERLVFCKKCKNRHLDFNKGLLCQLTGKEADFEGECPSFEIDSKSPYIPKPKETIRPNRKRAKVAENFIWSIFGIGVVSLVSSYFQYDLLLKVQEGFYVSDFELTFNDLREGVIAIINVILYVLSVIFFIRWFRRAYYNLRSRTETKYDEGWAAGSWFVPILNLFRPYQIMKEIDDETGVLITRYSQNPSPSNGALIGFWWAMWILAGMIGRYVFKTGLKAETLEDFLVSTQADLIGLLFDLPLCILAIYVIRGISKKEERLLQLETEFSENVEAF
jgi:hypothetical protein